MSIPLQLRAIPLAYGRPEIPEAVGRELIRSFLQWGESVGAQPAAARILTPQTDGWCVEIAFTPGLHVAVADLDGAGCPGHYTISARLTPDSEWIEICRTHEETP